LLIKRSLANTHDLACCEAAGCAIAVHGASF
jgi:hypothetical protein